MCETPLSVYAHAQKVTSDGCRCSSGCPFPPTVPSSRGRSEALGGLAECQAVPSEGNTVLCVTEDPQGSPKGGGGTDGNSATPSVCVVSANPHC